MTARSWSAGGWPAPTGHPTALAEDGEWVDPASGLFGAIPARRPGTAGVMVRGQRWDYDAVTHNEVHALLLLPTPVADHSRGLPQPGSDYASLPNVAVSLLPTPTTQPQTGNGHARNLGSEVKGISDPLLPTPVARDHKGDGQVGTATHAEALRRGQLEAVVTDRLLPTPAVNDMGAGKTVEAWDAWTEKERAKGRNGNGHGPSLHIEAARLAMLPTPTAGDALGSRNRTAWREAEPPSGLHVGDTLTDIAWQYEGHHDPRMPQRTIGTEGNAWGPYAAAIARWERVLGRPAPPPTEQGRNGPRPSPLFVEWLMGLPAGWVVDVPGVTRNHALKALGNGVVPQQAAAAFALLGITDLFGAVAA